MKSQERPSGLLALVQLEIDMLAYDLRQDQLDESLPMKPTQRTIPEILQGR
jgi:hypothetical protein